MAEITYSVPDMSCDHCKRAVTSELLEVGGVESVDVDLDSRCQGPRRNLDDAALARGDRRGRLRSGLDDGDGADAPRNEPSDVALDLEGMTCAPVRRGSRGS